MYGIPFTCILLASLQLVPAIVELPLILYDANEKVESEFLGFSSHCTIMNVQE